MTTPKVFLLSAILLLTSASADHAQQQIIHTVTAQSKNCNATCSVIDVPELNNNPNAVVFITPNGGAEDLLNSNPVHAWVIVEILNASNNMVARATTETTLVKFSVQNMNSVGFGILPAGTYHTRVSINRYSGGSMVVAYPAADDFQGGQLIIEIFPD